MTVFLTAFICLLYFLTALLPAGAIISYLFECTFKLISIPGFTLGLAVLGVCLVILDFCSKYKIKNKAFSVFLATLLPLAMINAMFIGVTCDQLFNSILDLLFDGHSFLRSIQAVSLEEYLTVMAVLIHLICCCLLTIRQVKPLSLSITSLCISLLMSLPIAYILMIALMIGGLSNETVVKTIQSPDGTYCAQVVDSDQGALGGNTNVEVYENQKIDILLFKIQKHPKRIYSGDWMGYETMEIYWKDDGCLVINSVEYQIE